MGATTTMDVGPHQGKRVQAALSVSNGTMSELSDLVEERSDRPAVDETGLAGRCDIDRPNCDPSVSNIAERLRTELGLAPMTS